MTPIFRLLVDNSDITKIVAANLISLSHHDQRGFESDTLNITLVDDGSLELPLKGAVLSFHIGFEGMPLVDRGEFIVDEVGHEDQGDGDVIIIDCKAADMRLNLKSQKTRSWHEVTLGQILNEVAADHRLMTRVTESLASINVAHEDQTGESDFHLITRLAEMHGAQAKINNGFLLFTFKNEGKKSSGAALDVVTIKRSKGDDHHYIGADRGDIGTVVALWRDTKTGKQKRVKVGSGDPVKQLKNHVYASQEEAYNAATGELRKIKSVKEVITLDRAVANLDLFSESPLELEGYRKEIDGGGWFCSSVDTMLDEDGLHQSLEAERGDKE